MDIVKKNLISVLCGVIAIVSIVVIFFPLNGMYAKMGDQLKKSAKLGDDMQTVQKTPRFWPTLSQVAEDKHALKHFPTAAIWKEGDDITKRWTSQATDLVTQATTPQEGRLKPLVPGALPGGTGQQQPAYAFMAAYAKLFTAATAVPSATPTATSGMPVDMNPLPLIGTRLVGRMPPTEADITNEEKIEEDSINQQVQKTANGEISNQDELTKAITTMRTEVGDRLRTEVALKSTVYADPALSFVYNDKITGRTVAAPNDIYLAQIGLWLQQEVCDAIYDTNKDARQGVVDAPIKRLIGIRFTLPYVLPLTAGGPIGPGGLGGPGGPGGPGAPAAPAAGAPAAAVPPMPTAKIAQDFNRNPFGQISNDLYDVLPFRIGLVCDAEQLPTTLTRLSKSRYFTFRNMTVQTLDAGVAYAQGYLYGNKPVVQVTLDAQWLLLRKVSGPLMPPEIIANLAAQNMAAGPGQPG